VIPLTVLVVVPHAVKADRIARAVVAAGHAPIVLPDGERAIDRFVQEPADVVIAEYFLPGRDGATTIESIRWAPGGRQAHAILIAEEEPETAALATIGARIDAVATFVGDPPQGKLTDILRSLDRKPPNDPRQLRPGELPPAPLSFLNRTTSILKGDKNEFFGSSEEESTVRGSASVARKILEAHRVQTSESAPRVVDVDASRARAKDDETRLAKRPSEERPVPGSSSVDPAAVAEGLRVRESARDAAPAIQQVEGRFESTAFPALLVRLAETRASGALVCTAEDEPRGTVTGDAPIKMVYFRGGVPVHVRSNLIDECLGQLLLRKKRIGAATLDESVRRMKLGHGLQGEILIDMGALSPLEVSETLAEQAREKLFDLFGWRRGAYRMTNEEAPKDAAPLELALPEMVYEGVCAAMPATRLSDLLTPMMDRYVVPDSQRLARFVRVRLPVELKAILARLDGTTTMRLLIGMSSKPAAVAQLVYSMQCLGAVRFEEHARKRLSEPPASPPSGGVPLRQSSGQLPVAPASASQPLPAGGSRGADPTPSRRPDESSPPAEIAPAAKAKPPLVQSWDDDSTTPQLDEIEMRQAAAPPVPSPPAAPAPPKPPTSGVVPTDAQVDRLFEAERHFRRGNRALERERFAEALAAFEQAATLCPDEGEFVAYVAWARHCSAPYDPAANERALTELERAATLAPALFVVSLLRARVLVHAGRRAEAREAYARVLALEPSSEEARVALAKLGHA
jgi:CheY-like chemotaxis protein